MNMSGGVDPKKPKKAYEKNVFAPKKILGGAREGVATGLGGGATPPPHAEVWLRTWYSREGYTRVFFQ